MKTRAESIEGRLPDLAADVTLIGSAAGGRKFPVRSGFGCVCLTSLSEPRQGWDAMLQIPDGQLWPGGSARAGFVFLSPEGAAAIGSVRRFYLWDGKLIGEAIVSG